MTDHGIVIEDHDIVILDHDIVIRDHDIVILDHDIVILDHDTVILDHDTVILDHDVYTLPRNMGSRITCLRTAPHGLGAAELAPSTSRSRGLLLRAMRTCGPLVFVATGVLACARPTPAGVADTDAPSTESFEALRESARETLEANCGECHSPGSGSALPRALAVYDLGKSEWYSQMTNEQLRDAARRLAEPLAPRQGEGDARPIRVSPEEMVRFGRFVDAVAEHRVARIP
jgi:hypothetical protein